MKKFLLIIFPAILFLFYSNKSHAAKTEITIQSDDGYPPYSYETNKKATGIYVDILTEAASHLTDFNVTFNPIPWKRGLKMLEDGEGFALIPPYFNAERKYIDSYSVDILSENLSIFCSKKAINKFNTKKIQFPDSYKDFRIGVNLGFSLGNKIESAFKNKIITKSESRDSETAIMKLILDDIDCYINDELSVYFTLKKMKNENYKFSSIASELKNFKLNFIESIDSQKGYIAYSANSQKFPYKDKFIKAMDIEINKLKKNGFIKKTIKKYQ